MNTNCQSHKEVNENQCQICMPLGAVTALKGIEGSMAVVHGSQGCSTYMRLSMVEHYHEPVDIASSSLNEKQTIYGGEENLRRALDNVIRVYHPGIIGVVTTCMTETMGEDIWRMIDTYLTDRKFSDVDIIPISTPSYSGTYTEGFWTTLRDIIMYYTEPAPPHQGINVILPHTSPADTREIKRILNLMSISYTILPDISHTLDRPYARSYEKIPSGGTGKEEIRRMSGARATIQFGYCCPKELSPGDLLEREYGVPLYNLPLPIGLKNMDLFIETLRSITPRSVPDELVLERGWLCDAMADSHKYMGEVRPALYGEPELVYSVCSLCVENGAYPALLATGTGSPLLSQMIPSMIRDKELLPEFIEHADFSKIEADSTRLGVNVAIGHSGGRVLTERHGIPLVRTGYPIHDRVGGQRVLTVGYTGTLSLLEQITNAFLEKKYQTYRQLRKEDYFDNGGLVHGET